VAILAGIWVSKGGQLKGVTALPSGAPIGIPVAETEKAVGAGIAGAPVSAAATAEIKYMGRENRDPVDNSFLFPEKPAAAPPPPEAPAFAADQFKVTALLWGSKTPQAIINDKVVAMGEDLGGGKIAAIDKDGVHVNYNGEEVLLRIK
jgi:hypothetical protein